MPTSPMKTTSNLVCINLDVCTLTEYTYINNRMRGYHWCRRWHVRVNEKFAQSHLPPK